MHFKAIVFAIALAARIIQAAPVSKLSVTDVPLNVDLAGDSTDRIGETVTNMFSKRKANTDWKRGVTQNTSSGVLELPTIVNSHSLKRDPQTGTDWRPRQEKVAHPKREAEAGTDWKRNAAANTDWKRGTDWRRDAARLGSISS